MKKRDTWGIEKKFARNFGRKTFRERGNGEDLGLGWRIILQRILEELYGRFWTGLICLTIGAMADFCKKAYNFVFHSVQQKILIS